MRHKACFACGTRGLLWIVEPFYPDLSLNIYHFCDVLTETLESAQQDVPKLKEKGDLLTIVGVKPIKIQREYPSLFSTNYAIHSDEDVKVVVEIPITREVATALVLKAVEMGKRLDVDKRILDMYDDILNGRKLNTIKNRADAIRNEFDFLTVGWLASNLAYQSAACLQGEKVRDYTIGLLVSCGIIGDLTALVLSGENDWNRAIGQASLQGTKFSGPMRESMIRVGEELVRAARSA